MRGIMKCSITSLLLAFIAPAMAVPDYVKDIRPLLKERCISCHGTVKQKGDLRLDAGALIQKDVHHDLLERIASTNEDERMPPEGKRLSAEQIELLRQWIAAGAPCPKDEVIPKKPSEHWSLQPVHSPPLPASAFTQDKPFDRFVLEQLAGDELPDRTLSSVIATGFLRLGHWDDERADPVADRYDQLDDIVSTTGQAFLGLTIGCARCHDHKFKPLDTRDYYSLVAVFNPLQRPVKERAELTVPMDGTEV